jgi:hypothetical protein
MFGFDDPGYLQAEAARLRSADSDNAELRNVVAELRTVRGALTVLAKAGALINFEGYLSQQARVTITLVVPRSDWAPLKAAVERVKSPRADMAPGRPKASMPRSGVDEPRVESPSDSRLAEGRSAANPSPLPVLRPDPTHRGRAEEEYARAVATVQAGGCPRPSGRCPDACREKGCCMYLSTVSKP